MSAFPAARRSAWKSCRWLCWSRTSRFSTRPIPGLTSMRCGSSRKASMRYATRIPAFPASPLTTDALRLVSEVVNALRDKDRAFLVIPHYQRLLDHITPNVVHVMAKGRIVKSGGPELALELERNGYRDYAADAA